MKFRRFITFSLIVSMLFFTACDSTEPPAVTDAQTSPAPVTAAIEDLSDTPTDDRLCTDLQTVTAVTLAVPDTVFADLHGVLTQGDTIILPCGKQGSTMYALYDNAGTLLSITDGVLPADDAHKPFADLPLTNGGILSVLPMDDSGCHPVIFLDADGKPMGAEYLLPPGSCNKVFLLDNGNAVIYTGAHITIFSPDGAPVMQAECDNKHGKPMKGPDNTVYFSLSQNEKAYYTIDGDTDKFQRSDIYIKPDTVNRNAELIFDSIGNAYLIDPSGILAYDPTSGTVTPMLDWNRTDYAYDSTYVTAVLTPHSYLVRLYDPLTNDMSLQILTVQDAAADAKTEIRLGLLDYTNASNLLGQLMRSFNRTSEDYHLTLTVYEPDKDGLALSKLEEDLLYGNAPDIMIFGTNSMYSYRDLANKDIFFDLNPYFGTQLLPNTANAFSDGGALYLLPSNMRLHILAAKADALPSAETLSIDTLAAYIETLSANSVPFSADANDAGAFLWNRLLGTAIQTFYDMENGTCTFDSPQFETLLSTIDTISDRLDTNNPYTVDNNGFASTPDLAQILDEGRLTFLEVPLHSAAQYMVTKRWFSDADIRFFGYPTADGHASYIESDLCFAVMRNTTVPRGAMVFLQFVLSDAVQNAPVISSNAFPVTADALESSLTSHRYYYYQPNTGTGDAPYSNGYVGCLEEPMDADMFTRGNYEEVYMTDDDLAVLRTILYDMPTAAICDTTIFDIVYEEYSAYASDVRDSAACAEIIQSRTSIYLAEKQ